MGWNLWIEDMDYVREVRVIKEGEYNGKGWIYMD